MGTGEPEMLVDCDGEGEVRGLVVSDTVTLGDGEAEAHAVALAAPQTAPVHSPDISTITSP